MLTNTEISVYCYFWLTVYLSSVCVVCVLDVLMSLTFVSKFGDFCFVLNPILLFFCFLTKTAKRYFCTYIHKHAPEDVCACFWFYNQ